MGPEARRAIERGLAASVTTDLIEAALAQARRGGAEQAEAYFVESASDSVDFENNRLAGIDCSASRGIGIRVLLDNRTGFASTSALDEVPVTVAAALDTARLTRREPVELRLPAGPSLTATISDPEVEALDVADFLEMGRAALGRLTPLADGLLAGAGAGRSVATVAIANTNGLHSICRRSGWFFSAVAQRVEGTSVLWCHDGGSSRHLDLDVDETIENVAVKVRQSLTEGRLGTGSRAVLFTPAALSALLGSLHSGVAAPAVHRGTSPLAGRLGERVLNAMITITDDLRPEAGRAGMPFDDEGVPAGELPIIDAGVLKNFVADLRFAARLGCPPGRGRRAGYASAPVPAAGSWLMSPGDQPLASLLKRAQGGLIVDSLLGMHGSNLANGDFSASIGLGFALGAGGEVLYRVKDAAIAGNFYEIFGPGLVGLSAERRRTYSGSALLPWALAADVAVT